MTTTNFPKDGKALLTLERSSSSPIIYTVTFTGGETPDNRLTHKFLDAILAALEHVEHEWDRTLSDDEKKGGAALVTTGQIVEGAKFYSNGCVGFSLPLMLLCPAGGGVNL